MTIKKINLDIASEVVSSKTDCTLCALCQKCSPEPLRGASRSKDTDQCQGYEKISEHMQQLQSLCTLQMDIRLSCMYDGQGIDATLT